MVNYPITGPNFDKYQQFFEFNRKDYHFKVDIETGKLLFDRKLISCKGTNLPVDLYLKYTQSHYGASLNLSNYTGLPKGFKFNYHVLVARNITNIKYEDKDGLVHTFVLAENSSSLYYDTGGTGLMMTFTNGCATIFDDEGNYQTFDTYGRLIKIHEQVTVNKYCETNITYVNNNSLKIDTISDEYGHTLSFAYGSNLVQIKYNNTLVYAISLNSSVTLNELKRYVSSSNYESDSFDWRNEGLDELELASGEIFYLDYSSGKVSSFYANYKQNYFDFYYNANTKTTTVENARNVATIYSYDQKQLATQVLDNNVALNHVTLSKDASFYTLNKTSIQNFLLNLSATSGNVETTLTINGSYWYRTTTETSGLLLSDKRNYVLYSTITGDLGSGYISIELYDAAVGLIGKLRFEGKTTVLACPIGLKDTSNRSFYLIIEAVNASGVTINCVNILPLIGDFETLCSNVDSGNGVFYYENTPYYYLPKKGNMEFFDSNGGTIYYSTSNYLTANDYLTNEKLFYKRSGNTFRFWCNDKTLLIDNASSAMISTNSSYYLEYSATDDEIIFANSVSSIYAKFYKLNGGEDNSLIINEITHDSSSFTNAPTGTYYQEKETRFVCDNQTVCYRYYFEHGQLIKSTRDDGAVITNTYDTNGNLLEELVQKTGQSYSIVKTYTYDSDDNLDTASSLMGSSIEDIYYNYDLDNNCHYIEQPSGLDVYYTYESISKEKLTNIQFDTGSGQINQGASFENGDTSEVYAPNDTYSFSYNNGELSGVTNNSQGIIDFTYYPEIYDGVTLYDRYYTYYSNSYAFLKTYDRFNRLVFDDYLSYEYDEYGNVIEIYDEALYQDDYYTYFTYDEFNNLSYVFKDRHDLSVSCTYDEFKRIIFEYYDQSEGELYTAVYSYYNLPGLEKTIKTSTVSNAEDYLIVNDEMDSYSRLASRKITISNDGQMQTYSYCHNSNQTNYMINEVTYFEVSNNAPITSVYKKDTYSYDPMGNITYITRSQSSSQTMTSITYSYDIFGRLIRENNPYLNRSYTFSYDTRGNITSKKEYYYSTGTLSNPLYSYTYNYDTYCPDRLVSRGGELFTYDNYGNPIVYRDAYLSWNRGTLLSSYSKGLKTIEFEYDGFKNRISKTVSIGDLVTNSVSYECLNGKLLKEYRSNGNNLVFFYSHTGVTGFVHQGTTYFYEKNIQQDVIAIRDSDNNLIAKYVYDAWGNHKVYGPNDVEITSLIHVANLNPFRYRSYYYDTDLKMYWLTTRYYDPEIGRFISPDDYSYLDYQKLHGINLYAYSKNNPVMYYDPSGHDLMTLLITFVAALTAIVTPLIAVGAAVTFVGYQIYSDENKKSNKEHVPKDDEFLKEVPYKGDGFAVYYKMESEEGSGKLILTVYESWRFSEREIKEFLNWLKHNGYEEISIGRVYNEWMWHNIAFALGIKPDSSRKVDAYLDSPDKKYGWFFELFHIWW